MSTIGNKEYSVEFNDSVFESQAWKKSRYEGQGLKGAQINRWTEGDITYGKTPVVRNVSRNIYIGNAIIDLQNPENESFVPFASSSYIQINKYFTVNNDDSISENNYDATKIENKNGFYRIFSEDFPIGGDFEILLLDESVPSFLKDNYQVFFNGGSLHIAGLFYNNPTVGDPTAGFVPSQNQFYYRSSLPSNTSFYGGLTFFLNYPSDYNNFYTGSYRSVGMSSANATLGDLDDWFDSLINDSQKSVFNRYFVTQTTSSVLSNNYNNTRNAIISQDNYFESLRNFSQNNLKAFSTAEIVTTVGGSQQFKLAEKFPCPVDSGLPVPFGRDFGYIISKLDNSKPRILTKLNKNEALPEGVGNAPFIVIPSNIHPYIKDNLLYFLSQAGIDIGNSSSPTQIYIQNRQLK
jgi:hypothetical protein